MSLPHRNPGSSYSLLGVHNGVLIHLTLWSSQVTEGSWQNGPSQPIHVLGNGYIMLVFRGHTRFLLPITWDIVFLYFVTDVKHCLITSSWWLYKKNKFDLIQKDCIIPGKKILKSLYRRTIHIETRQNNVIANISYRKSTVYGNQRMKFCRWLGRQHLRLIPTVLVLPSDMSETAQSACVS
jgi:hypothetical protein